MLDNEVGRRLPPAGLNPALLWHFTITIVSVPHDYQGDSAPSGSRLPAAERRTSWSTLAPRHDGQSPDPAPERAGSGEQSTLTPGPSPRNGRGEPVALTPGPSPETGEGSRVALTPCPSPRNGRGESVALTPGPSPATNVPSVPGEGSQELERKMVERKMNIFLSSIFLSYLSFIFLSVLLLNGAVSGTMYP